MPYVTEAEIEALLPPAFLTQALDDDGDGDADTGLLDQIITLARQDVDARIGQRFDVPRTSPEPVVKQAALRVVLSMLYERRGFTGEANPHTAAAERLLGKLDRIGRGEEPLTPEATATRPPISTITEDSRLQGGLTGTLI